MTFGMSFSGDKKLLKRLEELSKAASNRVGKKAITAGVKLMAKAIKKEIPSTQKSARKAIGYSFKRPRSGKWKHVIFAKAGAGAGMSKKRRAKAAIKPRSGKKKGVGIGVSNVMWLLAGTDDRYTGSKRVGAHRAGKKNARKLTGGAVKFTGRMKKSGIVQRAETKAGGAAKAVIKGTFAKELIKELKRI